MSRKNSGVVKREAGRVLGFDGPLTHINEILLSRRPALYELDPSTLWLPDGLNEEGCSIFTFPSRADKRGES